MDMIYAMVFQHSGSPSPQDPGTVGFDAYYIDHTAGLWPRAADGVSSAAPEVQARDHAFEDRYEDLASAEQKARSVYENLLREIEDPDVRSSVKSPGEREILHFQRFG